MKTILTLSAVLASLCLVGCGGPGMTVGGGKQGAAEALYAVSGGPTKSSSAAPMAMPSSLNCSEGGSVGFSGFALVPDLSGKSVNLSTKFTLELKGCAQKTKQGLLVLNGSLAVEQAVAAGQGAASVNQKLKGTVQLQGDYADFLEVDLTQAVNVAELNQSAGGVSVTLKGTLKNKSGTYTYDEAVQVTPGSVTVDLSGLKQ